MYVGKASIVIISGYDKDGVKQAADEYCKENGFQLWSNIYREFRLFKWKWQYKIDLCKPVDFKITKT